MEGSLDGEDRHSLTGPAEITARPVIYGPEPSSVRGKQRYIETGGYGEMLLIVSSASTVSERRQAICVCVEVCLELDLGDVVSRMISFYYSCNYSSD